jgi:hypothetical protein
VPEALVSLEEELLELETAPEPPGYDVIKDYEFVEDLSKFNLWLLSSLHDYIITLYDKK